MFLSVALKKPNGISFVWMDVISNDDGWNDCDDCECGCFSFLWKKREKKWQKGNDINEWVKNIQSTFKNLKNVICYNDDEPGDSKETAKGHTKGVVMWNEKRIGWLIHSVPNYPRVLFEERDDKNGNNKNNTTFEKIEESQLIYGQSFVYIENHYSEKLLDDILKQLSVMEVHIYMNPTNKNINNKDNKDKNEKISLLSFSGSIVHVSKSSAWKKDLYEDFMYDYVKSPVLCQTWAKPATPSTERVKNAKTIKRISSNENNKDENESYQTTQDHSKYAVSMDEDHPWVLFGDINHMDSQRGRGGGGLLIRNYGLWKAVNRMMIDYTDIVPNPNFF